MTDFGQLRALEVTADKTVEFTLYQVQGTPTLILAPATESNIPLFNAALKRSGQAANRARAGAKQNLGTIKEGRAHDRELYAKFVVKGWYDVVDVKGNEVALSKDNCLDFLTALPDYMFDDVREFAREPSNFVGELPDTKAVAEN